MLKQITGNNIKFQLWVVDDYYDIFCAKSGVLSVEQDELEVTSILSGSSREYIPGMMNATFTTSGVSTIDNSEGKIAIAYLMQQGIRQGIQQWRVRLEADDADTLEITFNGIIRSSSLSKDGFAYNDSNLTVRITGDIDFSEIIVGPLTDFDLLSDTWETVNAQNYVSGASTGWRTGTAYTLAATDEVIGVWMEGTQYDLSDGVLNDGERKAKFTTAPQRVTFPADMIFDGSQRVFIQFKRPI